MKNQIAFGLVKSCKYALRQLNNAFGYDFEKPFNMVYFEGNFTVAGARKLLGVEYDNFIIVVKSPNSYFHNRFMIVKAVCDGFELVSSRELGYFGSLDKRLDSYYIKADFNDDRKSKNAQAFFVYQAKEYRRPIKKVKPFDYAGRYKVGHVTKGSYNGNEYASQIDLMPLGSNGHKFTWKPNEGIYSTKNRQTLENCIDKSGYILTERRRELKARAEALRQERQRAAYLKTDDTAKVNEIAEKIAAAKAAIIKELEKATTPDEFNKIGESVKGWHGLRWIVYNFEIYKRRTAERDYPSVEAANKAYNEIAQDLENLTKGEI